MGKPDNELDVESESQSGVALNDGSREEDDEGVIKSESRRRQVAARHHRNSFASDDGRNAGINAMLWKKTISKTCQG